MLCDLAEYYNIYSIEGLSCSYVATLVNGLSDDSRTKRKMSGLKIPINTFLLASMADQLAFISWSKTIDAERGRNKPKSILKLLLGEEEEAQGDRKVFTSIDEFMKEWNEV